MAHDQHSTADVPQELINRHRQGWNFFTHFTGKTCAAVAVILLLMLLFLRVL